MTQSRRTSFIEATTQATVALPIGFIVSFAVGILHLSPTISAVLITGLMYIFSVARCYLVRRHFDAKQLRHRADTREVAQ